MKVLFVITLLLSIAVSCKKIEKEPVGPTDIRVRNLTTLDMSDLTVSTYDSTYNYGLIQADSVSDYHRFNRAYPKANIFAFINGQKYKTDTVFYTYMQYLGTVRATYEVFIESEALKKLVIHIVMESDLK